MHFVSKRLKKIGLLACSALLAGTLSSAYAGSQVSADLKLQTFGGDAQLDAAKAAVIRFNEDYPNVKVEVSIDPISNGWGAFVTKVFSQFNAGNSYDVYHTAVETLHALAARDLVISLDDKYKTLDEIEDFDPRLFELSKYKDKVYFIPSTWNNIMVNYNRALFDEAKIEYPKSDWNWQDFTAAAQALTKRDSDGNVIQFGYEVPGNFFISMPWFFTNDTSIVNDDWTESNMLDPKVAETLQYLYNLIHKYKVSPVPTSSLMDNQFFAGQIGMISRGHWIVQNAISSKMDMDVVPPASNRVATTVIGFGAYGISRDSEQKELAWALIQELLSKESQIHETKLGGAIPGRKSIAKIDEFLSFPPSAELYYATLPSTRAVPSPVNFQEIEKIYSRNFLAMMSGELSIQEGVERTHKEFNKSFSRAKRITGN
ncbi:extracellular solute-binding protein [Pseudovibrio sp. Tun.PSC04-5.I4]|uniref:extracellular solute-binding protein n=1 Tax=Pseudovibrio sp. Tun.PSC04-5.I4 TaxID=1798213 RepID=UPI00089176E6|nr:extracellular solute-binding protein [Pseudovibrio sp. Tun.PSC04-5.I4]SDR48434.1 carbohydrate ABC transporter substrate-binding protein, CUT1 family [Pseudovibrio sp. Tun.PSC04-5.I4]